MLFASPRTSPVYPYTHFGGNIYFINTSSHGLYFDIDIIDKPEGGFNNNRLCLEKEDIVLRQHIFIVHNSQVNYFNRNIADPNNHFKKITIYDTDSGSLIKEILPGSILFVLKTGSIENNTAVFTAVIDDSFLSEGQQ